MNLRKHSKHFTTWRALTFPLALLALGPTGCDEPETGDTESGQCDGGKCDTPSGSDEELCLLRQSEVLESSQRGFTPDAIRWACADVEGVNTVNQDDRGQEYCEYYAVVQTPNAEQGVDLGRPRSRQSGDVTDLEICLEGEERVGCRTTISEDDLFTWEDNPSEVVGSCVFTSWHADVPGPLPACADGQCPEESSVFGLPLTEEFGRMKIFFNSNGAASDLVQRCVNKAAADDAPMPEDWSNADDPLTEPFFRGCMSVQEIFGTGWRRSDPSVCAVANRLVECGCGVPGVETRDLGTAVVPPQTDPDNITLRGFRLGTWDDPDGLPGGCRYATTGDDSQTVVVCDLTAADVTSNLSDVKEQCRALYGNQVVVHVPLPSDAIECNPPDTETAASCGDIPWNIGRESAPAGE